MATILVGDKHRQEQAELIKDPIIIRMAEEVRQSRATIDFIQGLGWTVQACNNRYHNLGGKNAKTIGGPAKAIQTLLKGEKDEI